MTDIFISYSNQDKSLAQFIQKHLTNEGIEAFLASVSLKPGQNWHDEVFKALKTSSWVFFLASRSACESPWVQQELGAALYGQKKLVPIIWDMDPDNLPGWVKSYQVLNISGARMDDVKKQITAISNRIKSDKMQGLVLAGLLLAGLFFCSSG